jgi:cell division protein FtsB
VLHPPSSGATVLRLPVRGPVDDVLAGLGDDATESEAFGDLGEPADDLDEPELTEREIAAAAASDVRIEGTPGVPRRRFGNARRGRGERSERTPSSVPGMPSPRSLQKVAMAVYAALADPIVNADPEARERRTAQARRLGLLAGSAALAVVLIYAIFPVRTYLEQRAATQRARERIDKLSEANAELEQRKEQLRDDETVEEIARRDYLLVFPGEESYGLLPPPVPPTTTTTTPPGG